MFLNCTKCKIFYLFSLPAQRPEILVKSVFIFSKGRLKINVKGLKKNCIGKPTNKNFMIHPLLYFHATLNLLRTNLKVMKLKKMKPPVSASS